MSAKIIIAFSFLHLFELVRVYSENVTISNETCAFQEFNLSLHHSVRNFVDERISNNSVECKETCCLAKLCDLALFVPKNGSCQLFNCFTNQSVQCAMGNETDLQTLYKMVMLRKEGAVASVVNCTVKQASECREHETCVVTSESNEGYQCNCLSGFIRNADGLCAEITTTPPPGGADGKQSVTNSSGADKEGVMGASFKDSTPSGSPLTVSLGDNKVLKYPLTRTQIQGTVIPTPVSETDEVAMIYNWDVISKPKGDASTLDHKDASATLSNMTAGVYSVQLEVRKGDAKAFDKIDITVQAKPRINRPPVAIVKPNPVKVNLPNSEAILNGADSTDDEAVVSYFWKEVKRPSNAKELVIDNSDPSNQILKLSGLSVGEYVVSLTVTDREGLLNTTLVNVTVLPATDYPPTANAGSDQVITLPVNSITLYGNGSTDDKEIVSYKWQQDSSQQAISLPADMTGTKTHTLHLSNLEAGTYTFTLEVEDSAGQTNTAQVHVIVEEPRDKPPRAVVSPAGPRDVFLPDSSVVLDASQSSDDNGIKTYNWSIAAKPPESGAAIENWNQAVTKLVHLTVEGTYKVVVQVTDTSNQSSAAELVVNVHPDTNQPPVANAGPDLEVRWPVDLLAVSGEKSTDDGEIVKWVWVKAENERNNPAGGRAVNQSDTKPVMLLSGLVPGLYLYHLTVQDVQGLQSTDSVVIKVVEPTYMPNLIELRLRVPYLTLPHDTLINIKRNIAVDLEVEDSEVVIVNIGENRQDGNTFVLFYVLDQKLSTVKRGAGVRDLISRKLDAEPKRYTFDTIMVETYICQNNCSGHGNCNSFTKQCECDGFWMENVISRKFLGHESNCDWSVLYFVIIAALTMSCVIFILYVLVLYTEVFQKCSFCRCYSLSDNSSSNASKVGNGRLVNGSLNGMKKLRRRRKRINNNEYLEVAQTSKSLGNTVEINLSTGENSSDELFTAKPSGLVANGVHKNNGFQSVAKET